MINMGKLPIYLNFSEHRYLPRVNESAFREGQLL